MTDTIRKPMLYASSRKLPNCRFLEPSHLPLLDEALTCLGEFGEVHLIVEKGRLRYVITQKSCDVLKWQPGSLDASDEG